MRILKVIACLLDYPTEEVFRHQADLSLEISETAELSPEMRLKLLAALKGIYWGELMDAEENYSLLFDQGRSLSLHLFEHVHGESRDRGQAMVDLMSVYQRNGYELNVKELPDYLPLFLEYLSSRPSLEAREWLADVSHILLKVCARLYERGDSGLSAAKHYALLLEVLLVICGKQAELAVTRQQVTSETPDNTVEAIDQEWEETAVTFTAPEPCSREIKPNFDNKQDTAVLHWVDATKPVPATNT